MSYAKKPRRRQDDLHVQEVGDELLIYDSNSGKASCLNPTTALIWRTCDGQLTISQIAEQLQVPAEWVEAAVRQLRTQGLLCEADQGSPSSPLAFNRRDTLRTAALAFPALLSLVVPLPVAASSTCVGTGTAPPGTNLGGTGGKGACSDTSAVDLQCRAVRGNLCCSGDSRATPGTCRDAGGVNQGSYSMVCECV